MRLKLSLQWSLFQCSSLHVGLGALRHWQCPELTLLQSEFRYDCFHEEQVERLFAQVQLL
jgi:hypothetical protein